MTPGSLHFLRRMKEQLVDYDSRSPLFEERRAVNVKVQMNSVEQRFYDTALQLVDDYFYVRGRPLASMVYGKRAASSLYALARTLRRRLEKMDTDSGPATTDDETDAADDAAEDRVVASGSRDAAAERQAIAEVLSELEPLVGTGPGPGTPAAVGVSKWDPMISRLAEQHQIVPGGGRQLVVFTEYADTADWLVRRFDAAGFSARRYSGTDTHAERAEIQAEFMDGRFDVIVSTDAGNEGIDLQAAHVLVNWDIPWSLVRLEQRMGRIHRIGQQHKVWLYNLIALGTREGDAHERLLDRLIEAANELGGKMFDSLGAVIERVLTGTGREDPQSLLRLFYGTGHDRVSIAVPTLEEIRRARDEHYSQLDALKSEVDADVANAARNADRSARVNPHIVERFLDRLQGAGLIDKSPVPIADDGFFYLSAQMDVHGWELPTSLPVTNGSALVATRADRRRQAASDGMARSDDAVMLGPSDVALKDLLEALRGRVMPQMWQGATVRDETASGDYTLFVYECDITEGQDGPLRRQRSRTSPRTWLIRVDADGSPRCVSWDTLPNLAAADDLPQEPLTESAVSAAQGEASRAAADEVSRRAEGLDRWVRELSRQLRRLPEAVTASIADRSRRVREYDRVEIAVEARINAAEAAASVVCGDPRRIGWARVAGCAAADDDPQADSEAVSMRLVAGLLRGDGWLVYDVHAEGRGYDLHAVRGAEQQCVEVKGRSGLASSSGITLTGGEITQAMQLRELYWLYVVENCSDGHGRLYGKWEDPVKAFRDDLVEVPLLRLRGSALKAALDRQGDT